eukprot:Skav212292  [mRNA]  locus=scaffold732:543491:546121:- [translate_table: standard]
MSAESAAGWTWRVWLLPWVADGGFEGGDVAGLRRRERAKCHWDRKLLLVLGRVFNAIESLGFKAHFVQGPEDILKAQRLIFPGVGAFGACVEALQRKGFLEPLRQYLKEDRPFFGICLGMQTLFESSEENPGIPGLGVLPGVVRRFPESKSHAVPNINWSGVAPMLHRSCA